MRNDAERDRRQTERSHERLPQTEPDVVYALVQIRKLLEQAEEKQQYDKLGFMCNWVAHPKMSHPTKTAKEILQTLDDHLVGISLENLDTLNSDGKAGEILSLGSFRGELLQFCKTNALNTKWVDTTECWRHFLRLYAQIIQDCQLEIEIKQGTPLKKLQKVVLIASDPTERIIEEPHPEKALLRLTWQLALIDGSSSEWDYNFVLSD